MLMTKDEASNAFIRYWQIIVVMVTLGVGWGTTKSELTAVADELEEQKEETKASKEAAQDVKLTVAKIEKDIEYIKDNQEKQDQKLDRIIQKLDED